MNLSDAMEDISAEDDGLLIHIERQEDGILYKHFFRRNSY